MTHFKIRSSVFLQKANAWPQNSPASLCASTQMGLTRFSSIQQAWFRTLHSGKPRGCPRTVNCCYEIKGRREKELENS